MHIKKKYATTTASLLAMLLAGCGGGGNDAAAPVVTSAEGVYEGTISNGAVHYTIVLENGQFYTLFGAPLAGGGVAVMGFIQGSGRSENGTITSTDLKEFLGDGTVIAGSLNAKYVAKTSLSGTVREGTIDYAFSGSTALKNSTYSYDSAANPANIAGAWSLTDLAGHPVALNIAAGGAFTGSSNGCSVSGTIQPRASGKNVFDFSLTFGAAPCALPGQVANGIALEYQLTGGKRQLLVAGSDASRSHGTAFLGSR